MSRYLTGTRWRQHPARPSVTGVTVTGLRLTSPTAELAEQVLGWRNDPEVLRWFLAQEADADELRVVLADEVLTPDSSRFWRASEWGPGRPQTSYDKQVLRDWLTSPASGWERGSGRPPPPLPDEVVRLTRARYVEAYETLTGRTFGPA